MSGYPYGGPPPTQPYGGGGYGAPPAGYGVPYGAGAPPAAGENPSKPHKGGDYHPSAPPSSAPYGGYGEPYAAASSQYAGEKPSKTGYQPSAPPAAGQYGGYADPYSAGSEKPSKAQQGGGYGDPYSEKPSKVQQGGGYGDPYSEKPSKAQQGGGYGDPYSEKPSKAQQGYGDPYGSGGSPYGSGGSPYDKPSKMQQGGGYQGAPPPQGGGYQGVPPPQGGGYQGAPPQGPYGGTPYGASPFAALVPSAFPPGTDPNVVACFQAADHDGSGFIDDTELQGALSSYNQSFSMRTVHLLMYLFTSSNVRKIGPKEFASVFYSLQSWRGIFDRADRDRSGKIDAPELRDALMSLGFAVSPVVLDLLVSKFDKSGGKNKAIEYDGFIECCLIVKGLTEKFKEKDVGFRGSATFTYESFMLTVLPFLVA